RTPSPADRGGGRIEQKRKRAGNLRGFPPASACQKSLAEFARNRRQLCCHTDAAEENQIVFPAACTSEKHFARSERRIVRHGRMTEAQSAARPFWRKRC